MNSFQHVAGMVAVGLLVAATDGRAQSGPPILLPVNIALTATIQNPEGEADGKGNVKETTTTRKLTSANILALAAAAHGTTYPRGATLAINTDGGIVVASGTNVVDDLWDLFAFYVGEAVSSGMYNENTYAWNDTSQMLLMLSFDDSNGTSFSLYGMLKATDKAGPMNASNLQSHTLSCSASLVGDGFAPNPSDENNSDVAVWSGTMSGKATGMAPLEE
jgi:hypothetical protein